MARQRYRTITLTPQPTRSLLGQAVNSGPVLALGTAAALAGGAAAQRMNPDGNQAVNLAMGGTAAAGIALLGTWGLAHLLWNLPPQRPR